jgi:hypothetical protein
MDIFNFKLLEELLGEPSDVFKEKENNGVVLEIVGTIADGKRSVTSTPKSQLTSHHHTLEWCRFFCISLKFI